jgi:hypothetical protein
MQSKNLNVKRYLKLFQKCKRKFVASFKEEKQN